MKSSVLPALFSVLVCTLFAMPAAAGKKGGVEMPDRITVGDKTLVLNGMGIREATIFKVDVYVAGLYLEHKSSDPSAIIRSNEAKRLVMHFVHDAGRDDITEAWTEGFEQNAPGDASRLKTRVARLNRYMSSMKDGQEMVFTYVPGRGTQVVVNGQIRGVIPGEDFAQGLFSVWLGSHPPNAGLKKGLLGR